MYSYFFRSARDGSRVLPTTRSNSSLSLTWTCGEWRRWSMVQLRVTEVVSEPAVKRSEITERSVRAPVIGLKLEFGSVVFRTSSKKTSTKSLGLPSWRDSSCSLIIRSKSSNRGLEDSTSRFHPLQFGKSLAI